MQGRGSLAGPHRECRPAPQQKRAGAGAVTPAPGSMKATIREFLKLEAAGGNRLFAGKQRGVFLRCRAAVRPGLAGMPQGANWASLYRRRASPAASFCA